MSGHYAYALGEYVQVDAEELVRVDIETITPKVAEAWLMFNKGNRSMRMRHIASLEQSLRAGEWKLTTDAIGFSETGRLINGQHRLKACVNTGIPIVAIVARNIPEETFTVLDQGTRRTLADLLHGRKSSFAVAAVVLRIAAHEVLGAPIGMKDGWSTFAPMSKVEAMEFYESNTAGIEKVLADYMAAKTLRFQTEAACASWYIRKHSKDQTAIDAFFADVFDDSSSLPGTDPARTVRDRILRMVAMSQKPDPRAVVNLYIKGWNARRKGVVVDKLMLTTETPKVAP